jgi:protein TonB
VTGAIRPPFNGLAASALLAALAGHLVLLGALALRSPIVHPLSPLESRTLTLVRLPAPAEPLPPSAASAPPRETRSQKQGPPKPTTGQPAPAPTRVASARSVPTPPLTEPQPAQATTPPPAPARSTAGAEEPSATPRIAAPDPDAADHAVRETVQRRVLHDFSRHFRYPALARRRGWEGAVRLRYDVTEEGRVVNVRLLASSGHPVLDRDAEATLNRIPPLEPTGWSQPVQALELAIHYRLTEG